MHFFWGSFDLAVTRFSGRLAPPREGPAFMRDAYSHEVISHGFWPGSAPVLEPAFYTYTVPEPPGFKGASVRAGRARTPTGSLANSSCRVELYGHPPRRSSPSWSSSTARTQGPQRLPTRDRAALETNPRATRGGDDR